MISRRGLIASFSALVAAPYIVHPASLMPVKKMLWVPPRQVLEVRWLSPTGDIIRPVIMDGDVGSAIFESDGTTVITGVDLIYNGSTIHNATEQFKRYFGESLTMTDMETFSVSDINRFKLDSWMP